MSIKNSKIAGNSRLAHGSYPGISLAAGAGGFQVVGNSIGGIDGFGNTQPCVMGIARGSTNNSIIVCCNVQNSLTGEFNNGATGTRFVAGDNLSESTRESRCAPRRVVAFVIRSPLSCLALDRRD